MGFKRFLITCYHLPKIVDIHVQMLWHEVYLSIPNRLFKSHEQKIITTNKYWNKIKRKSSYLIIIVRLQIFNHKGCENILLTILTVTHTYYITCTCLESVISNTLREKIANAFHIWYCSFKNTHKRKYKN